MHFLIRDDDANALTSPETIERYYRTIYARCPVTFGVIAYLDPSVAQVIPARFIGSKERFELSSESEIIAYLREKREHNVVAIAQHGATHAQIDGRPECATASVELHRLLARAHDHLSTLLDSKIETFIPPHNALALATARWAAGEGMAVMGVPQYSWLASPGTHYAALARRCLSGMFHRRSVMHLLSAARTTFIPCVPLTPSIEYADLEVKLRLAVKHGEVFCIATHYWELHKKSLDGIQLSEALDRLVDVALNLGATPATPGNLTTLIKGADATLVAAKLPASEL